METLVSRASLTGPRQRTEPEHNAPIPRDLPKSEPALALPPERPDAAEPATPSGLVSVTPKLSLPVHPAPDAAGVVVDVPLPAEGDSLTLASAPTWFDELAPPPIDAGTSAPPPALFEHPSPECPSTVAALPAWSGEALAGEHQPELQADAP